MLKKSIKGATYALLITMNIGMSSLAAAEPEADREIDAIIGQLQEAIVQRDFRGLDRLIDEGEAVVRRDGEAPGAVARFLNIVGMIRFRMGDGERAESNLSEALELTRSIYGGEHPLSGSVLANWGTIKVTRGKTVEGVSALDKAVEILERFYGASADVTANARINLGTGYFRLKKFRDAIANYEMARRSLDRNSARSEVRYVTLLNNLGTAYLGDGAIAEAERVLSSASVAAARGGAQIDDEIRDDIAENLVTVRRLRGSGSERGPDPGRSSTYVTMWEMRPKLDSSSQLSTVEGARPVEAEAWIWMPLFGSGG